MRSQRKRKKTIRAKLKKAKTNKEYKSAIFMHFYDPYSEYDCNWTHGDFPNHKWREFKTWKHNRKTQWKK